MAMSSVVFVFVFRFLIFTGATYPSNIEQFSSSVDNCGLVGKWKNELGSTMEIKSCQDGSLSGSYNSKVGTAMYEYTLAGRYTVDCCSMTNYIVGFSVAWNNSKVGNSQSTTSWTGIYYASDETIHTHWILTTFQQPASLWMANQINHDDFRRTTDS